MRKFLFATFILLSCGIEDTDQYRVVDEYLTAIENEEWEKAYRYIDNISRKHVSLEEFADYWQRKFREWGGSPDSHTIYTIKRIKDTTIVDMRWYLDNGEVVDLVMKLLKNLEEGVYVWRVKFLKWKKVERRKTSD